MHLKDTDKRTALILFLCGLIPVIWAALKIAPYTDENVLDIMENLKSAGISQRTAENAKAELGIRSFKEGAVWYWKMP